MFLGFKEMDNCWLISGTLVSFQRFQNLITFTRNYLLDSELRDRT